MKLNRKLLRKMILQEMATYKMGPESAWGRDWEEVKEREDDEKMYDESPAQRRQRIQAELNAKGVAQIKGALGALNLDDSWLPPLKQKMNQYGWITRWDPGNLTITFEGTKNSETGAYDEFVWNLSNEIVQ